MVCSSCGIGSNPLTYYENYICNSCYEHFAEFVKPTLDAINNGRKTKEIVAIWHHSSKIIVGPDLTRDYIRVIRDKVISNLGLSRDIAKTVHDYTYILSDKQEDITTHRIVIYSRRRFSTRIAINMRKIVPGLSTLAARIVAKIGDINTLDIDSIDRVLIYESLFAIRYLYINNL
jgi:hypothetical protein